MKVGKYGFYVGSVMFLNAHVSAHFKGNDTETFPTVSYYKCSGKKSSYSYSIPVQRLSKDNHQGYCL